MKSTCCRSLPRCSNCPVVLAAHARFLRKPGTLDAFVAARGLDLRELPACVTNELERLDERRAAPVPVS